ncbi:MAG: hypothetical protein WD989_01305 [Candidatus Paceibacterota bacterium]
MERIYLKPICEEILHKDSGLPAGQAGKDGHLDLFAYDYETDEAKRKLGSLYLVGNVQPALAGKSGVQAPAEESGQNENDVAYVTNLVASLAKREYYSNPDLTPKEAFSLALKKINDVIGEFFTNKDVKINIGIFAIAGEQINISKLGKFKIILSRENKNIDILNNIDLFTKERVQEKEFSHIVSGKILEGDKIFAYYPGRFITAREKYLKDYLLKLTGSQFREKIDAIKNEKPDFSCAALYIDLAEAKAPALSPKLKAVIPKQETEQKSATDEPKVQLASNKPVKATPEPETEIDMPRIIRAEFSLGKKLNVLQSAFNKIKPFMPRLKNKAVMFVVLIGIIIVSALTVKSLFILSPNERQEEVATERAKESLKLAKTKISQNDILGARQLLAGSLASLILSSSSESKKTAQAKSEIVDVLDEIDNAIEASPILVDDLPASLLEKNSLNQAEDQKLQSNEYNIIGPLAFDIYENNLYALTADNIFKISDINNPSTGGGKKEAGAWLKNGTLPPEPVRIAVDGSVYVLNKSGLLTTYFRGDKKREVNTFLPSGDKSIFATTPESKNIYLINKDLARIYILSKETGSLVKTLKIGSSEPIVEAYLNKDETIYFSTPDGRFWKIQ